jgi:hypothetical protein
MLPLNHEGDDSTTFTDRLYSDISPFCRHLTQFSSDIQQ